MFLSPLRGLSYHHHIAGVPLRFTTCLWSFVLSGLTFHYQKQPESISPLPISSCRDEAAFGPEPFGTYSYNKRMCQNRHILFYHIIYFYFYFRYWFISASLTLENVTLMINPPVLVNISLFPETLNSPESVSPSIFSVILLPFIL